MINYSNINTVMNHPNHSPNYTLPWDNPAPI